MRNIRLTLEYLGTDYCGWQVQDSRNSKPSIQGILEKTLRKILGKKIKLIGSGRTDAGVHALAHVGNFKTDSDISLEKLRVSLNALLPGDISVVNLQEVPLGFHSRFQAKSKLYRYTVLNSTFRSAFLKDRVYFCHFPLNIKLMQKEARVLLGKHDFKAFQATDKKEKGSVRSLKGLKISKVKDCIYFDIEANGFLHNMARNIVGTLIEIGRGRFAPGIMKHILKSKDRRLAGPTAPACGLCLVRVRYY